MFAKILSNSVAGVLCFPSWVFWHWRKCSYPLEVGKQKGLYFEKQSSRADPRLHEWFHICGECCTREACTGVQEECMNWRGWCVGCVTGTETGGREHLEVALAVCRKEKRDWTRQYWCWWRSFWGRRSIWKAWDGEKGGITENDSWVTILGYVIHVTWWLY